jgi:hypothetical protein
MLQKNYHVRFPQSPLEGDLQTITATNQIWQSTLPQNTTLQLVIRATIICVKVTLPWSLLMVKPHSKDGKGYVHDNVMEELCNVIIITHSQSLVTESEKFLLFF